MPCSMEPIDRLEHIQKERWELTCSLCRQRMGAKLQCASCYTAFHPLCARLSGLTLEVQEPAAPGGQLRLVAYCAKHCVPKPGSAGGCQPDTMPAGWLVVQLQGQHAGAAFLHAESTAADEQLIAQP